MDLSSLVDIKSYPKLVLLLRESTYFETSSSETVEKQTSDLCERSRYFVKSKDLS